MAEVESEKTTTLAQQYSLQGKMEEPEKVEQSDEGGTAAQSTNDDSPANVSPEEVVEEKNEETPAAVGENSAAEESSEAPEQEETAVEESVEQTPEVKLETAPVDFRFPTTNQTRHCFTRYIEYHRCIGAKGEGAPECEKFAKYYRSLCPGEWIDRWNEQRENGTFPGPL